MWFLYQFIQFSFATHPEAWTSTHRPSLTYAQLKMLFSWTRTAQPNPPIWQTQANDSKISLVSTEDLITQHANTSFSTIFLPTSKPNALARHDAFSNWDATPAMTTPSFPSLTQPHRQPHRLDQQPPPSHTYDWTVAGGWHKVGHPVRVVVVPAAQNRGGEGRRTQHPVTPGITQPLGQVPPHGHPSSSAAGGSPAAVVGGRGCSGRRGSGGGVDMGGGVLVCVVMLCWFFVMMWDVAWAIE